MERLAPILDTVTFCINIFTILVLLWGFVQCAKNLLRPLVSRRDKRTAKQLVMVARIELGRYVLLALEILIVADIIESIVNPTLEELSRLAAIVGIRILIAYFLNKEIGRWIGSRRPEPSI